ncbi:DUF3606 domain-containing protein [Phenylobacterium sp.]|jgi:hypothetical protein|uniref:DUF3606 domain-containing protein n=1 Tax=Phenylobacterium sp. TaxID=1871053 RepID=UPI002F920B50
MRPNEERSFDGPGDIDLGDAEEVRYWAERLEASPEELADAVEKVGPNRTAVGLYLGQPAQS